MRKRLLKEYSTEILAWLVVIFFMILLIDARILEKFPRALANPQTYTVDTLSDDPDDGLTLREAIVSANANAGQDTILFSMSSGTIALTSALPALTDNDGVLINAVGSIMINGENTTGDGLVINSSNNQVQGLFFGNWSESGIRVQSGDGNIIGDASGTAPVNILSLNKYGVTVSGGTNTIIAKNHIGLNTTADGAFANTHGIYLLGGDSTIIDNVISGNTGNGVLIYGSSTSENELYGNYIGLSGNGSTSVPNGSHGVNVYESDDNDIGVNGQNPNVITGNTQNGVFVYNSDGNTVYNNYIGTNITATGTVSNSNQLIGVQLYTATNSTVGGGNDPANIISGNAYYGVYLGNDSANSGVWRSYIGTDITGNTAIGNTLGGIYFADGSNNTITENYIGGNGGHGINLTDSDCTNIFIRANYIGIGADGTSDVGNNNYGINIEGSAHHIRVGDESTDNRNYIGYNGGGIRIAGAATYGNGIVTNYIGLLSDGETAAANGDIGIRISDGSYSNTIGGLNSWESNFITGHNNYNVYITENSYSNSILSNYIGTNVTGDTALTGTLSSGVYISDYASNNSINYNVLSGHARYGVYMTNSSGNTIHGNYIGTNAAGTGAVANQYGIIISANGNSNTVGGAAENERNIISGSTITGLLISSTGATLNTVTNNYIGTSADGLSSIPNNTGISISSADQNTIGGTDSNTGNVISGNTLDGIYLSSSSNNTIQGNYIGVTASGSAVLANNLHGIRISGGSDNTIGNTLTSGSNVISGNLQNGVYLVSNTNGNTIQGNYIGLDSSGENSISNGSHGILSQNAYNSTIGGASSSYGNIIGFNVENGVFIYNSTEPFQGSNTIRYNAIGTDLTGSYDYGNDGVGVYVHQSPDNTISNNQIKYNGQQGILLSTSSTTGNTLSQNSITQNESIYGIYLYEDANNQIASPNLLVANTTLVSGHTYLDANNATGSTIELYASADNEGDTYLTALTTNNNQFEYNADLRTYRQNGYSITATITSSDGTSMFSSARPIAQDTEGPAIPTITYPLVSLLTSTAATNQASAIVQGTKEAYSGIWLDDTQIEGINTNLTWAAPVSLSLGSNQFYFSARDYALNESTIEYIIVYDNIAPAAPGITSSTLTNRSENFSIEGTKETNTYIMNSDTEEIVAQTDASTTWKYAADLTANVTVFRFEARDLATNDSDITTYTVTLDQTAPAAPEITYSSPIANCSPTLTGTAEPDAAIYVNGENNATANSEGAYSFIASLAAGTNSLEIKAEDAAGNQSELVTISIVCEEADPGPGGGGGGGDPGGNVQPECTSNADCADGKSCLNGNCVCADNDSDGYKDPNCGGTDCHDSNADIYPGALEICDGLDNDCDGEPDAGETDADNDGHMLCQGDCNDSDASVHPDAEEVCSDNVDNDCVGGDEICVCSCEDADADGHYATSCGDAYCSPNDDCDDSDTNLHPGVAEICGNSKDDNCNGQTDENCGGSTPAPSCNDSDGDGYNSASCGGTDCDDSDAAINPGQTEIPGNNLDDDCNSATSDTVIIPEETPASSGPGGKPGTKPKPKETEETEEPEESEQPETEAETETPTEEELKTEIEKTTKALPQELSPEVKENYLKGFAFQAAPEKPKTAEETETKIRVQPLEEKTDDICENPRGSQDSDGDGLSDYLECQIGTDPTLADTDGDGYSDAEESIDYGTDPLDSNNYPQPQDEVQDITVSNWSVDAVSADTSPLIKGLAHPKAQLYFYVKDKNGNTKLLGKTTADQDSKYLFESPYDLLNGSYQISIKELDQDGNLANESGFDLTINSALDITPPNPLRLGGETIKAESIVKDVPIEINTNLPTLYGTNPYSNLIFVTWQSAIQSSALVVDSLEGTFSVTAPYPLEPGPHTAWIYAIRPSDGARSKEVKISFIITEGGKITGVESQPSPISQSRLGEIVAIVIVLVVVGTLSFLAREKRGKKK